MWISEAKRPKLDSEIVLAPGCEFCAEFSDGKQIGAYQARVLFETRNLVVIPSLGPVHPEHLLICTREHRTALYELTDQEFSEVGNILGMFERNFSARRLNFIAFENGTKRGTAGGCSIIHYHLHVVPLSSQFDETTFRNFESMSCGDFVLARSAAESFGSYIMIKLQNRPFLVMRREGLPSQFMRRLVATSNGRRDWDWRLSNQQPDWSLILSKLSVTYRDSFHSEAVLDEFGDLATLRSR
jgi:diadenosine tetraphosphate (Ap4A) HIT family hydrolase